MRIDQIGAGQFVPQVPNGAEAAQSESGEQVVAVPKVVKVSKVNTADQVVQDEEDNGAVINDEMLDKAVTQANKSLKSHNLMIERSVHEVTKTIMYKMRDTETNEVIREFPPRKIQDMIAKMWELAGLFVDEKA